MHEFRHAVNTAKQTFTNVSTAFLNYGREPIADESDTILVYKIDPEAWKDRLKRLKILQDLVAKYIDEARE